MQSANFARNDTLKLSLFFFILFTASNSFLPILTHIYEQESLPSIGPANLCSSYILFILSSLIAPGCKWRFKGQMIVAAAAYSINFAMGIAVPFVDDVICKYLITCFGGACAGTAAGFLWVSQGGYLHLICKRNGVPQQQKGKYFGIFSSIYCLTNISAGIITTFGLGFFNNEIYFVILTVIGVMAICVGSALRDIYEAPPQKQLLDSSNSNDQILLPAQKPQPYSALREIRLMFAYYPSMLALIPMMLVNGIAYGVFSSQIMHMIPNDTPKQQINLFAGLCAISLGFGASLGGYLSGAMGDRMRMATAGRIGLLIFMLSCGINILTVYLQEFAFTLVASFSWGFSLFYIESWMTLACSRSHAGNLHSFAITKQVGCLIYLCFQICVLMTENKINLIWLMVGCVGMACVAGIALGRMEKQKNGQEKNGQDKNDQTN